MTKTVLACGLLLVAGVGCSHDRPARPPVDELSNGGRGLQGKDVISASDQMAQQLLSLPALNASQQQWTIVVDHVENLSTSQRQNLDIFLKRLRVKLSQLGQNRVTLIENRAKLQQLQANELDVQPNNPFGQGGVAGGPNGRVQPDFALSATLSDLPNEETNYFLVQFSLTDLHRGISVWDGMYEVATYQ